MFIILPSLMDSLYLGLAGLIWV